MAVAAPGAGAARTPGVRQPDPVAVTKVRTGGVQRRDAAAAPARTAAPKWPAAGTAEVDLAAGGRAGALPVSVAAAGKPAAGKTAGSTAGRAGKAGAPGLKVTLAGRPAARRAGVEGLLLTLARTDAAPGKVPARVTVDYAAFRGAYGGDWAARLRLVELPACALTTPAVPACRVGRPLATKNDVRAGTLSATALPAPRTTALAAPKAMVLAATADPGGPTGDYKATSLQASGSWDAGGSNGAFTWSHPIAVPGVPGGLTPSISLAYNSQSVDGRTSASNNQPSWIGDGWDWEPGFIERRYKPCNDDKTGGTNTTKVGDLCWFNDNATLSLGGKSTELVWQQDKGWVPESDSGEKVEKLTGAANGDDNGEHWKVTTTDGTQYFFGLNRLPGWKDNGAAADDPVTNSAWTAPVFGNQSGEPCYNSSFAAAWCKQAWRWQLDYTVDPHGNAIAYYWNTESNNYGRNVSSTTGKGTVTPYTRGGWLDHIDYGLRADAVYTGKAMGQVQFGVGERCLTNCGTFDETNARNWPDVPYDLYCKDGATECKDKNSPTFWSRKRLTSITTRVLTGGAYKDVDTWALDQSFPPAGDGVSTPMWLKSIQRTGKAGDSLTLPPTTFAGEQRPNRVDKTGDGLAPFVRLRLYQITNETGGTVGITYSQPDCTTDTLPPADATNTTRCYPVKWAFEGDTAKLDWFNKYVVTQVTEGDNLAGTPDKVSTYAYLGGAAWAKSTDELTKAEDRTYSVARGYGRVQVRTGASGDAKTLDEKAYFRGIDGAAVKDTAGAEVTDRPQFAGMVRETVQYLGDDTTKPLKATSYTPWRSAPGNTRTRTGLPDLVSYKTGTEKESTRTTVTGGVRTTEVTRRYDALGMVDQVSETGDTAKSGDEKCATTTYVRGAGSILNRAGRVETVAVPCGSPVSRPADVIDDVRTSYDGAAFGVAPTRGLVTRTEHINGTGTGYTPVTTAAVADFDLYGRQLRTVDPFGKATTTVYTPATGEVPTQNVVTNPKGHTATTVTEPLRGLTTQLIDANGKVTASEYDALGRLTKVWKPGRSAVTYKDAPTVAFEYLVRNDAPTVITSKTLTHDSQYDVALTVHDGMLRERQTQRRSPDGAGRLLTETFYDTLGRAWRTSGTYYATGTPDGVLVTGKELDYPSSSDTEFDGAGRPTAVMSKRFGTETKRTTTVYTGDTTTTTPPQGGIASTTVVDALGRTVEQKQYADPARLTAQSTKRTYDRRGQLASVTDPSGARWTYTYDVRGRQIEIDDPDKGVSKTTYDDADRITDVQDARGVTLHTDLDELGRRTALKKGTTLLASWAYDTVAKGRVDTSVRYVGGNAYESSVLSYSPTYQPVTTQTVIPAAEGALAGTYKWTTSYDPTTGAALWTKHPAIGGLPAEQVTHTYSPVAGLLDSVSAGDDPLVSSTRYDHYGRNVLRNFGQFGRSLTRTQLFDEHTGELTDTYLDRETAPQRIDDSHYTYDPAGNVKSLATSYDKDAARTTDTQCFAVDALRRVTDAWTDKGTQCAAAPSAAAVGGADPYWTSYTYDAVGNRRTETQHRTGSGPAADTLRTYAAPSAGSHDLTKVSQTGTAPREDVFTYDAVGNTATRKLGGAPTQTFNWDDEGHLASVTEGSAEKGRYVYDTDGQRLIRKDATGTSLYLSYDTELHLNPDGSVTGTRSYSADGTVVAFRTGSKLTFTFADRHGTGSTQVSADAGQAVTRRRTTPFGAQRGPKAAGWAAEKGFVGGTEDGTTGTVHLGAREYDPATGRFLSVDPVVDLNDPQQAHGYTYGNNNPVVFSDPTGRILSECWDRTIQCHQGRPVDNDADYHQPPAEDPQDTYSAIEDYVASVIDAGWGSKPRGSSRRTFKVPAGENRGIIRMTYFISSKQAALGMLYGDDREFTADPTAAYRMTMIWDTATGEISFTITGSHTRGKFPSNRPESRFGKQHSGERFIPARPLKVGGVSSDTYGWDNVVEPNEYKNESTAEELRIGVHAVNSYLPVFSVDADITIRASGGSVSVTRKGDAYPDMEVYQYLPNQSPRTIMTDRMASDTGLDSAPFSGVWGSPKIDKSWTDGRCTRGC
ncbi:RHS repeat-associated core domain-containing protein [Streptomyces sp. NPDC089919]|uniref:RHS repeat domain-containing protein n=1 Tax=Streptomyces sp. NPDC089919 TaxID=3155188 RepID=UPI00342CC4C8